MSSFGSRVEQELIHTEIPPPYCIHGPTLLFRRHYTADKPSRTFYACSVHRNRKGCSFFHYSDQPLSNEKREQCIIAFKQYQASLLSSQTITPPITATVNQLSFCIRCSLLYDKEKPESENHVQHEHQSSLSKLDLCHPTKLLYPCSNNKGQAQYFFSDETQAFLLSELKRLSVTHVICLGTPRFYEVLSNDCDIKGYLLDIDHRYSQFYNTDVFQRFNMFNGFFYSSDKGKESIQTFIKSVSLKNILLIIDPPFGGLLSALKTGINVIWNILGKECTTLLIFPYFNESHVIESFPNFHMSDYQVTYDNHRYYGVKGKRSKPSPVRIFTNLSLPGLILPVKDGYKYCSICNRYVSSLNEHCSLCNKCTSKDGKVYRHCSDCKICVKQSNVHCLKCDSCHSSNYNCTLKNKTGCYVCGGQDHKRLHCPSRPCSSSSEGVLGGGRKTMKRKRKDKCVISKKPRV